MKARLQLLFVLFLLGGSYEQIKALSAYCKHDPYPVYTTQDPHLFLLRNEILSLTGERPESIEPNSFSFSVSPFFQCASYARGPRNLGCESIQCQIDGCSTTEAEKNWCNTECLELGDALYGPWSLIPLLFCNPPEGCALPPTLLQAQHVLFPGEVPPINHPELIDPYEKVGFVSWPGSYQRKGLRFETDFHLIDGFGVKIQGGISDICFTVTAKKFCGDTIQCDCAGDAITEFEKNVRKYLTCKYRQIACELGYDIRNFHECSIEDVWVSLWWRKAFELLENPDCPHYVIAIPFFTVGGELAIGRQIDPHRPWSLGFNNNGHHAIGLTAGIDFNWIESIEFGGEFGITHFFSREIDGLRIPNSMYQSGIFPFCTDACISPGKNCHLGGKIACCHFYGCLSFFWQYIYLCHLDDEIKIKNCDPAYVPCILEQFSSWKVHLFNVGFNYDISNNLSLGILWQGSVKQCNTFKTNTVMFSLSGIF